MIITFKKSETLTDNQIEINLFNKIKIDASK